MVNVKTVRWMLAVSMLLGVTACSPQDADTPTKSKSANPPVELGGARPARVILPADYSTTKRYPLIVLLHGYSANATAQDLIFGLKTRVDREQFILVLPEGTKDSAGNRYWNATPECCQFDKDRNVNDVAYLGGLIDEAVSLYTVDPERVNLVGHSNGGYMSYRMACEMPEKVRRVAVLAGSVFLKEASCQGSQPVSVLHMHGTDDRTVPYDPYLETPDEDEFKLRTVGAEAAIQRWAAKASCAAGEPKPVTADFHTGLAGDETDVLQYTGCTEGIDIELWRINGGDHVLLEINNAWRDAIVAFLLHR